MHHFLPPTKLRTSADLHHSAGIAVFGAHPLVEVPRVMTAVEDTGQLPDLQACMDEVVVNNVK